MAQQRRALLISSGLLFSLLLAVCQASILTIEHSVDSKTFTPGGHVEGDLKRSQTLGLERLPLTQADQDMLRSLIQQDGFYTLRVKGGKANDIVLSASVRASCLTSPEAEEEVHLDISLSGVVVGLSYIVRSPGCGAPSPPGASFTIPPNSTVHIHRPVLVPSLLVSESELLSAPIKGGPLPDFAAPSERKASGGAGGQQAQQQGKEGAAQGEAEEEKPDDRTWWQKNWLFLAGGAMMVVNIMGKFMGPQAQGGAPGARPAAAGGARR